MGFGTHDSITCSVSLAGTRQAGTARAARLLRAAAGASGLLLRQCFDADTGNYLTQQATQDLFKLGLGKVAAVRSAEGSVIVRTKEIQPIDLEKEKDTLDRFGKQLDVAIGNDLVAQLLMALRLKFGVQINEAAFAAAFQFQQQQQPQQ